MEFRHCQTKEEVNNLFEFFYTNLKFYNKDSNFVFKRSRELTEQFQKDKEFLLFIMQEERIIAALSMKYHSPNEVVLGMLAVEKEQRHKGIGTALIEHAEDLAKQKGFTTVSLGAILNSELFYIKNNYKPTLMITLPQKTELESFTFENNQYKKLEILNIIQQGHNYSIFLKIDEIDTKDVLYFKSKFKHIELQYIFTKQI